MRIDRFALAAVALVASTALISCSSDSKTPTTNTVSLTGSLPGADTTAVVATSTP
ncbi:MAG: hypothetical protein QOC57_459 [Ilumatobacteraceae bacterium]|jgi:hypothetical protein